MYVCLHVLVGLTEPEAVKKFGAQDIKVDTSDFINLYYGIFFKGGPGDKPVTKYKLICEGPQEKVVGIHLIGMASDEVIQGFAVAMKMGAVGTVTFRLNHSLSRTAALLSATLAWALEAMASIRCAVSLSC
jgi:pyruvate/2-oxoglutarate dehydrogenase complex dihydrolipoamide dehydrogenase (E3) component